MSLVLKNRVKSSTTTTGTGTITLGAAEQGYQGFSAIGNGNETYYLINGTTEWEVGKGTYTSSGTTLSREFVFSSSNNGNLVNFSAGTKNVICVLPAAAMSGGIPSLSDQSVNSDGTAWQLVEQELTNSIASGTVFNNENIQGSLTVFSDSYPFSNGYTGAVMAPNGDIHFAPYNSNFGEKVSSQGIFSTYSLVYTASGAYIGGVLAPDGTVHFIPHNAAVGQRIRPSSEFVVTPVSTYSLVYTTSGAYAGGVLAPNGDIHFAPYNATVGQKISAAGVVSTYSIPTNDYMYGGVLSSDGQIYFVPTEGIGGYGTTGLKINASGVAQTYTIIDAGGGYRGGVISPNGEIHFVPWTATVGQKISRSGVVSTYSLAYTTSQAYFGGVLSPTGDIHFVPHDATVGQKISPSGVVSTYPIGSLNGLLGGILGLNGIIYFVSGSTFGGILYTNSGNPPKIGACLSSFFNKF